jgi:3-isopropylmalate/(R)-2-methylmalate dehydratase small subunit
MKNMDRIKGTVRKFGDHVDTGEIYPGWCMGVVDPYEMAAHAMEGIDADFTKEVQEGDIIVAGEDFGRGSSREQAPLALKYAGIQLVIADYFARLFYRNVLNIGLPVMMCKGLSKKVNSKEILRVNLYTGKILNENSGEEFRGVPLSEFEVKAFENDGLFKLAMEKIASG